MKEIKRVAIAGCGRIAFLLEKDPLRYKPCTHLGALRYWMQKDRRIVPVGFCDPDKKRAQAAAEYLAVKDAMVTPNFSRLLECQPDLLVIAASTATHVPMLKAAIKAKIPRIVLEKPVAISANEAYLLRRLLRQSNSVVLPNYERRYHEKYLKLRQLLARNEGIPTYRGFFAAGGKSLYPRQNGDEGVLLHDTTHLVDLAQFLFGPIKKHKIIAESKRHFLYLEHTTGATGMLETNLGIGVFHLELEIRLHDRRITVGNGFTITEKITASPNYRAFRSYASAQRVSDVRFPVARNPFVRLYHAALYGTPNNGHFFDAIENVALLTKKSN